MGDTLRTIAVLIVAVMVLGFVGAYALLFHGTPEGQLALGALLPIAGARHLLFPAVLAGFFRDAASRPSPTYRRGDTGYQRELWQRLNPSAGDHPGELEPPAEFAARLARGPHEFPERRRE